MDAHSDFAEAVRKGLQSNPKNLPSRYFYDAKGDALFVRIMHLPEYYLSRSEMDVLVHQSKAMVAEFGAGEAFDVVELGAGDGTKTRHLLEAALAQSEDCSYLPIDISAHALQDLKDRLGEELPHLKVHAVASEYQEALKAMNALPRPRKRLFLFLGSNLGNMAWEASLDFLSSIRRLMQKGDGLLLGLDLVKDPRTIEAAYNDAAGVTRAFNLNLLDRINRELGADFDMEAFDHAAYYEPVAQEARSFLISTKDQEVYIESLGLAVSFRAWEAIKTEISRKYSPSDIEYMQEYLGLKKRASYYDCRHWFVDVLWTL